MALRVRDLVIALTICAALVPPRPAAAQAPIVSDGTMPTPTRVDALGGDAYSINGGTVRGTNLFHSFDRFNVPSFGLASFESPGAAVNNVVSRVTGHLSGMREASSIDGTISTRALGSANFYLINPAGVIFGPNAFLDVGGAFRVSTADYLKLENGQIFSATPVAGELLPDGPLWAAPPQAFGFLNSNPASIVVNGSFLVVDPEQTLSLVGGDVRFTSGAVDDFVFPAEVRAPGGTVQIVSVASPGEIVFSAPDLNFGSFTRGGLVTITEGAIVNASGDPSGTVFIRAGRLVVDNNSRVASDTVSTPGPIVGIDVRASESLLITNGAFVGTVSEGSAAASDISITGGNLTVSAGGLVSSSTVDTGRSGGINIDVANADIVNGGAIRTTTDSGTTGSSGNVTVSASGTVTVSGATSEISSGTFRTDNSAIFGGDIIVSARDVVLRDAGIIRSGSLPSEQAGQRVAVNASNSVSISSLGGISSQSFSGGAGAIDISAPSLSMDKGFINTSTLGAGAAGQILVNANTVGLTNGAQIASSSQLAATGAGGSITINAPGSVMISGVASDAGVGAITFTGTPNSGLFSTAEGRGNAGQITVSTPTLTLTDQARITVATKGLGNAGIIAANVSRFALSGGARMDSSTSAAGAGGAITVHGDLSITGAGSGLFSTASSTGNAGQISVSAPTLTVSDGGKISVVSTGAGDAGSVTTAGTNVLVTTGGQIDSSTTGAGDGGAINIGANRVEIRDGGSVRADSTAAGLTGNITVAATDRIIMSQGSISTRAASSDGGNITLTAPNVIRLENSEITTSVESGVGGGGNVFIDPEFVIMNGSTITANAFGGPGGNITVVANNFVTDPTSFLSASSALSTPGTVRIESPDNNLASDIAQLPRELVDASRLLRGGCTARRTGAPSSFVVAGRGGVPADPDGYLPSFSASGSPYSGARGAAPSPGVALAMAGWDCWQ